GHANLTIGETSLEERVLRLDAHTARRRGEQIGKRIQSELEPGHPCELPALRCADSFTQHRQMIIRLPLGGGAGRAHTADDDLPELLAMDLHERPERGARGLGAAVLLAPGPVILKEPQEGGFVYVAPVPLRLERRDRFRRGRQQLGWIIAGRTAGSARRSEPVPGDDAEVAAAPAGMRPPEVAM